MNMKQRHYRILTILACAWFTLIAMTVLRWSVGHGWSLPASELWGMLFGVVTGMLGCIILMASFDSRQMRLHNPHHGTEPCLFSGREGCIAALAYNALAIAGVWGFIISIQLTPEQVTYAALRSFWLGWGTLFSLVLFSCGWLLVWFTAAK